MQVFLDEPTYMHAEMHSRTYMRIYVNPVRMYMLAIMLSCKYMHAGLRARTYMHMCMH